MHQVKSNFDITNKITKIGEKDIMLPLNMLHFLQQPICSKELDFVATSVKNFYLFSEYVSRARKMKTFGSALVFSDS